MPEYKRFIAYFYEYIDGRKQKNAGFAKVELRNGMWRILFRIRTDQIPETPVQVFGFVRERGYLRGFLLGNMSSGYEISEDWAYGADKEIGYETYRFGDLSGIWIQSGEGRKFITVWDDDPIDVQKFVRKMPEEVTYEVQTENKKINIEKIESKIESENLGNTDCVEDESSENAEDIKEESSGNAECMKDEKFESTEDTEDEYSGNTDSVKNENAVCEEKKAEDMKSVRMQENTGKLDESCIELLFCKRKHIQLITEWHLSDCVQIMPCDVVTLQQKGWQSGRSSFLQHGFYQYHHLLLGKNTDGEYILGVPGIKNTQEQYMAQLFGYDKFLRARVYDCGKVFGYWCRKLQK